MAHKSHRWKAHSLQASLDLQHIMLNWECSVRGCSLTLAQSHTFTKPGASLGKDRVNGEPDWVPRKEG